MACENALNSWKPPIHVRSGKAGVSRRTLKTADRFVHRAVLAFRKYAPELHRYVERRVREPETAPDLTQDIFERFLQVKDVDAVRNPQAYLFGIASHVVREARYRTDRNLITYDSEILDAANESLEHAWPDDAAERLALERDLHDALIQLPAMHRVVLLLVKRDGFSYEEAARKTKLSVATVTSYLFEARARLKQLLKHRRSL